MRYKKLFIIIFLAFIVLGTLPVQAAEGKDLDTAFPEIKIPNKGDFSPQKVTTSVPDYVAYLYYALIGISGLLALGVLISGGLQYILSSGRPDEIKNAKDRIFAALLGLLILFGSWILLYSINPSLVTFSLPGLNPITSDIPRGVLLCRKPIERMDKAFQFAIDVDYARLNSFEVPPEKAKELDEIVDEINSNCYVVPTAGDIRASFDNKITDIYSVPNVIITGDGDIRAITYGSVVYGERGFQGTSWFLIPSTHLTVLSYPEHFPPALFAGLEISSIYPFSIRIDADPNGHVNLYEDYNLNNFTEGSGVSGPKYKTFLISKDKPECTNGIYCIHDLSWSPRSIKIEGDLLAFLFTDKGQSEAFYSTSDNNLEDNLNIVKQVSCTDYKKQTVIKEDCKLIGIGYNGVNTYESCCAAPAATKMVIISAKPY